MCVFFYQTYENKNKIMVPKQLFSIKSKESSSHIDLPIFNQYTRHRGRWIWIGARRTHVTTPRPIRLQNKRRRCSTHSCRCERIQEKMFLHTCLLSLAFQERNIYSSTAWRIKGWSNSCLPHTSSQKKNIWAFSATLHY